PTTTVSPPPPIAWSPCATARSWRTCDRHRRRSQARHEDEDVSRSSELVGIAAHGIASRKVRTLLILLGPVVAVAAMVGAVGRTESAKGDLKEKLAQLGTNLITAQAAGTFGQQNPTLPKDAVTRVKAIPTVERASAVSNVDGVLTLPSEGTTDYYQAFPVPVLAADRRLPSVLEVPMRSGRWLRT